MRYLRTTATYLQFLWFLDRKELIFTFNSILFNERFGELATRIVLIVLKFTSHLAASAVWHQTIWCMGVVRSVLVLELF